MSKVFDLYTRLGNEISYTVAEKIYEPSSSARAICASLIKATDEQVTKLITESKHFAALESSSVDRIHVYRAFYDMRDRGEI